MIEFIWKLGYSRRQPYQAKVRVAGPGSRARALSLALSIPHSRHQLPNRLHSLTSRFPRPKGGTGERGRRHIRALLSQMPETGNKDTKHGQHLAKSLRHDSC